MILPELPQRNKKEEADFGLRFRKWWVLHGKDAPYELKDTRGKNYLNFKEITEDQIAFALACGTDKGVLVRVERGTVGASDYIGIKNKVAFFVLKYPKGFTIITVNNLLHEKETHKRKSLTFERACSISTTFVKTVK